MLACFVLVFASCAERKEPVGAKFVHEVMLKTTPVKQQGQSSLCWAYAMLATIETEHLMRGDSVNLSADYVARHLLRRQAQQYYLSKGSIPMSMRGMATMLLNRIGEDGLLAYDSYHVRDCDYRTLQRKLTKSMDGQMARRTGLKAAMRLTDEMLDESMRPSPRYQFMAGAEYTAMEFAHSVCGRDEYEALTSFTHHPYGERFVLEVPDNRERDMFLNVRIDSLLHRATEAIRHGHPVCWEGDISEPGFNFARGTATIARNVLQEKPESLSKTRQQMFERFETTDDHCMAIVGIAHDNDGQQYFVCKNSWGTNNAYGGFVYMSFRYFQLKTIAIIIPKEI